MMVLFPRLVTGLEIEIDGTALLGKSFVIKAKGIAIIIDGYVIILFEPCHEALSALPY